MTMYNINYNYIGFSNPSLKYYHWEKRVEGGGFFDIGKT